MPRASVVRSGKLPKASTEPGAVTVTADIDTGPDRQVFALTALWYGLMASYQPALFLTHAGIFKAEVA